MADLYDRIVARLLTDLPDPDEPGPYPTIPELGRQYKLTAFETDSVLRRALACLREQGVVAKIVIPDQQIRQWRLTGREVPPGQRPGRPPH